MRKHQRVAGVTNSYSIMALDDDPTMTLTLQTYFRRSGYHVDVENDPYRAIERIRDGQYDILLLDFLMTPICGDQVVEQIRSFNQDLFIILLTGHKSMAPPIKTIRDLDIQGYYEKSDRFDQLELLVESCIKSIKQMRTIQNYQQGLTEMMETMPRIYNLRGREEIAQQLLETAVGFLDGRGGYLALCWEHLLDHRPANWQAKPYLVHAIGAEPSLEELDQLSRRLQEEGIVQLEDNWIVAPIISEQEVAGYMGIQTQEEPQYYQRQLLGIFARQASSALWNAMLRRLLIEKNGELVEANKVLRENYEEVVTAMRLLVDTKDIYTRGHSDRVSYYSVRIARAMGKDEDFCERLRVAGLFHDIGKIGVSDEILFKDSRLTDQEYAQMKEHSANGARILSAITQFQPIVPIVRAHHERVDGKGYPDGLRDEQIPLEARIISVADSYDAMTSNRRYRSSLGEEKAVSELLAGKGAQFDSGLVDVFLQVLQDKETLQKDLASLEE
ncbi:MAG: HD domain-containing protein [Oscillospiraceae bacterium]|nr:HD domain-containing protein [Oscillospiraceae bacterium]